MIGRLREKVLDPLVEYQEKARVFWQGLNLRERIVLAVLTGLMSLLIVILLFKELGGLLLNFSGRTESNLKNIEKIQRFSEELAAQRNDLMRYETLRAKRGENFNFLNFLQQTAGRLGVELAKSAPTRARSSTPSEKENEDEEWFEVQLNKNSNLEQALKLLEAIEYMIGVRIAELSIKPQFSDPSKVEVTFIAVNKKTL